MKSKWGDTTRERYDEKSLVEWPYLLQNFSNDWTAKIPIRLQGVQNRKTIVIVKNVSSWYMTENGRGRTPISTMFSHVRLCIAPAKVPVCEGDM